MHSFKLELGVENKKGDYKGDNDMEIIGRGQNEGENVETRMIRPLDQCRCA